MLQEQTYKEWAITASQEGNLVRKKEAVTVEFPLRLQVNGRLLVNLLCTPSHLEDLVVGFLYSEGLIADGGDILDLKIYDSTAEVKVRGETVAPEGWVPWIATGCGQNVVWSGPSRGKCPWEIKISSQLRVSHQGVTRLIQMLQRSSVLYQKTRGVHAAALATPEEIFIFREDIGRHNAVDKIIGRVLRDGLDVEDKLLLTTGRMSSEVVIKAARLGVPLVVSRSVPSDYAIWLAENFEITLVGFVRGSNFKIYTHNRRIV
ncbi:formate dehydrogenase accessory sulfurtransferase FdhD [Thermanaeromonas sp. C210]|uniref:formate dehydrogenase accessory sulfurtransferase FdhD n=1 Tax=Thermanaeromonas sp. C210 TaxID=2731925 RepID=UPI00155B940B|nr:formate dehydrogenase accessory sulfurtransferase FdhD [Thermanaeromonas sp. C210]GFN22155.1 sulfurtransferase FdhD [Thermanaeromonas sp. C210]